MDYEWLVEKLIETEYVEDGPELDKLESERLLKLISEKTGKTHMLIININIDLHEVNYDYILDNNDKNEVVIQEWDNRYL